MSALRTFCGGLLIALIAVGAAGQPYYIDLVGDLGGTESRAVGVNDAGEVVGRAQDLSNDWRAFLDAGGAAIDLGALGGGEAWANDVDSSGRIVGAAGTGHGSHAFLWEDLNGNDVSDPGEMADLGTLGGSGSAAYGINDLGAVVGSAKTSGLIQHEHAFYWTSGGGMIDLGVLDANTITPSSQAWDVNDSGAVVGKSKVGVSEHAFYWYDANGNNVSDAGEMLDLGTLGGSTSWATAINSGGTIVGVSSDSGGATVPFAMTDPADPNTMTSLGSLGGSYGEARGVNDSGQIVGYSLLADDSTARAFLYRNGQMLNLQSLHLESFWQVQEAWAINDLGQIVGVGQYDGLTAGFLMTPALPGDGNMDGSVDDADYTIWADNYGATAASWVQGDFNADGVVDDADYTIWADNYGATALTPAPAALAFLLPGAAVLLRRRR